MRAILCTVIPHNGISPAKSLLSWHFGDETHGQLQCVFKELVAAALSLVDKSAHFAKTTSNANLHKVLRLDAPNSHPVYLQRAEAVYLISARPPSVSYMLHLKSAFLLQIQDSNSAGLGNMCPPFPFSSLCRYITF